ncbi:MAG: hypothetical protein KGH72_05950 [Candidatus Micrarchaeota archaeon]|nr:hypothetical protein [Candidatus Micrarchaeota archaeon]
MAKKVAIALVFLSLLSSLAFASSNSTVYATLPVSMNIANITINQGQQEQIKFTITGGDPTPPLNYSIQVTNASNDAYVAGAKLYNSSSSVWYANFTIPYSASAWGKLAVVGTVTDQKTRLGTVTAVIYVLGTQANTSSAGTTQATTASQGQPSTSVQATTVTATTSNGSSKAAFNTTIANTSITGPTAAQESSIAGIWSKIVSFFSGIWNAIKSL